MTLPLAPDIPDRPIPSANAPGTLFPGLYGDTPGDQRSGMDITGQPLPPLSEGGDLPRPPMPEVGAIADLARSSIPTPTVPGAGGEGNKDREAVADVEPPTRRSKRTLQDRIDTLTRRYRQEQAERSGLEVQMERLMGVIEEQNKRITELGGPSRAPSAPMPASDPLGLGDPIATSPTQPTRPTIPFSLEDVSGVVQKAIESYDQRARQANAAAEAHRSAHEASFAEALEEMPELGDQRTRARKLFNQLYDTSPLRALPDAPYHLALQVRGLLAAEEGAANPATVADRKRQASIVAPQPSATDVPTINTAAIDQELQQLGARMRSGEQDFAIYKRWRQLRAQRKAQR